MPQNITLETILDFDPIDVAERFAMLPAEVREAMGV